MFHKPRVRQDTIPGEAGQLNLPRRDGENSRKSYFYCQANLIWSPWGGWPDTTNGMTTNHQPPTTNHWQPTTTTTTTTTTDSKKLQTLETTLDSDWDPEISPTLAQWRLVVCWNNQQRGLTGAPDAVHFPVDLLQEPLTVLALRLETVKIQAQMTQKSKCQWLSMSVFLYVVIIMMPSLMTHDILIPHSPSFHNLTGYIDSRL